MRDYAAAGLNKSIQLYGSGFLTEGVLESTGDAADGVITTMHYSDSLDTPRNKQFRLDYAKTFKLQPDVYAVQGYDTGLLLIKGANAVKGDLTNKKALYAAMEGARDRQPARQVDHEQGPQPGAGHLPAQGGKQGKQGDRRGAKSGRRFRPPAAGWAERLH